MNATALLNAELDELTDGAEFTTRGRTITEGDLTLRLETFLPLIGHVQIAAVPSRAEPDEGEIDYGHIVQTLARLATPPMCGGYRVP